MEKSSRAWDNSISVHIHLSHVEVSVYQSGQEASAVSTKELNRRQAKYGNAHTTCVPDMRIERWESKTGSIKKQHINQIILLMFDSI